MKSTTLYLIRHGETDWNRNKRIQGHRDTVLNEKGQQQARLLAEELKEITFDAIYASPLQRTFHTAKHLANAEEISTDPRLREIYYGIYEGLHWSDFLAQVDEKLKEREMLSLHEKMHFKFHDSTESYFELYTRAKTCLDELILRHPGKNIAVVTHGGFIKSILSTLKEVDPRRIEVENVGYVVLKAEETQYTPIRYCRIILPAAV